MYFARVLVPKKTLSHFLSSCLSSNLQNVKNIFLIRDYSALGTVEIVNVPIQYIYYISSTKYNYRGF